MFLLRFTTSKNTVSLFQIATINQSHRAKFVGPIVAIVAAV